LQRWAAGVDRYDKNDEDSEHRSVGTVEELRPTKSGDWIDSKLLDDDIEVPKCDRGDG
jgi:hypothetical protein